MQRAKAEPLTFSFPGSPVPLGRPRTRVFSSKTGGKAFASIYTPPTSRKWMDYMASIAVLEMRKARRVPLDGPLGVTIQVTHAPLKSGKTPKRAGDLDNHVKAVLDALNQVAFHDDSQVVHIVASMLKANSQTAGIAVTITPMDDFDLEC